MLLNIFRESMDMGQDSNFDALNFAEAPVGYVIKTFD